MTPRLRLAALLTIALVGCGAPADSSDPTPTAAQSPASSGPAESASAAASASEEPEATATPIALGDDLVVPGFARVVADEVVMRVNPALAAEPLFNAEGCIDSPDPNCGGPRMVGTANGYVDLYVLDGPVSADGYDWYLAATELNTETRASAFPAGVGWVAAGDDEDAWLVPAPRSCPSDPVELADVTYLVMTRLEQLDCFGREPLTLRGWYPDLPLGERDPEADLEACRAEQGWLPCYSIFDILRPEQGSWGGDADYLLFAVDPDAGVAMPGRSQWVEVTGAFDHPAADSCGDVAAVLICRFTFVVTSAEVH